MVGGGDYVLSAHVYLSWLGADKSTILYSLINHAQKA